MNEKDRQAYKNWREECGYSDDIVIAAWQAALKHRDAQAATVQQEPVELYYPDFNYEAMGCGLEDRGITNRYEAMHYGWESALDRVAEMIKDAGPLYAHPPTPPDVAELVKVLRREFPLLNDYGLDEEKHHCEWSIQQDRKRLYTILAKHGASK